MQATHWRDELIARSEAITDAWEVTKTYAGRLAEWVLFICMIINIVEILPGVVMWTWVSNAVLGVQAVTLDIAGFGLASMADHARANGDVRAANRAQWTGYLLITIMVVTVSLVTCGSLWIETRWFTDPAEKVLILVRVVMTVVYGHVVHGLRRENQVNQRQEIDQRMEDMVNQFNAQLLVVQSEVVQVNQQIIQTEDQLQSDLHRCLIEASTELQSDLQSVSLKLQQDQQALASTLSILPELKQQMAEIEASTQFQFRVVTEEVNLLSASLDEQKVAPKVSPPILHVLSGKAKPEQKLDLQSFVYRCLDENPEATIEAIQKRAEIEGQTISAGSISRYRKQYSEASIEASN